MRLKIFIISLILFSPLSFHSSYQKPVNAKCFEEPSIGLFLNNPSGYKFVSGDIDCNGSQNLTKSD